MKLENVTIDNCVTVAMLNPEKAVQIAEKFPEKINKIIKEIPISCETFIEFIKKFSSLTIYFLDNCYSPCLYKIAKELPKLAFTITCIALTRVKDECTSLDIKKDKKLITSLINLLPLSQQIIIMEEFPDFTTNLISCLNDESLQKIAGFLPHLAPLIISEKSSLTYAIVKEFPRVIPELLKDKQFKVIDLAFQFPEYLEKFIYKLGCHSIIYKFIPKFPHLLYRIIILRLDLEKLIAERYPDFFLFYKLEE